ncbi:heme-degrading monooxygenase HmoA/DNA-binding transcriptional ArsR family regulator [Inhella inkyongensis]|uniref:Heme-degrading monooxygenase HmoA/DNA-binding transcriptional ArsR family regulator n=1 Tax=Inhella inkyongensis TaxID=392593 RepID=A0A840S7R9_9BURK|nr:antibiotic biosynthesis monooxygenase [Inhella inkyongensis]MBB5205652.1 heme-degrading monooxygenase HmoA/DNA-binding transcriptional ArsR family regulator [Inhella inkyongensis]
MIAVIFEVELAPDTQADYLAQAAALRESLSRMPGFLSIERFESLSQPGKLLSLSFWTDESSVRAWREQGEHRAAQAAGRAGLFTDYRLRVAQVLRDYGLNERDQAPCNLQPLATLIADPSRAAMLSHLLSGELASASELARAAGVGAATASAHLRKLLDAGWLVCEPRGRHRYYRLADADVAQALQALQLVADRQRGTSPWLRQSELRYARRCYGHLAGRLGVCLAQHCLADGWLVPDEASNYRLADAGLTAMAALGMDPEPWRRRTAAVAHACLDWSERRDHLAGPWPRALLAHALEQQWLQTRSGERALALTPLGAARLSAVLGPLPAREGLQSPLRPRQDFSG